MRISNSRGYTLIELLITIAILGVIVGVISTTFLTAYRGYVKSRIINQLQEDGNRIMSQLSRYARSSIEVTTTANSITFTLDQDSIEYAENGQCQTIVVTYTAQTGSANGRLNVTAPSCGSFNSGGVITDTNTRTGISVTGFSVSVTDNGTTNTQEISMSLTFAQAVRAPTLGEYQGDIELETQVTTRSYIR